MPAEIHGISCIENTFSLQPDQSLSLLHATCRLIRVRHWTIWKVFSLQEFTYAQQGHSGLFHLPIEVSMTWLVKLGDSILVMHQPMSCITLKYVTPCHKSPTHHYKTGKGACDLSKWKKARALAIHNLWPNRDYTSVKSISPRSGYNPDLCFLFQYSKRLSSTFSGLSWSTPRRARY